MDNSEIWTAIFATASLLDRSLRAASCSNHTGFKFLWSLSWCYGRRRCGWEWVGYFPSNSVIETQSLGPHRHLYLLTHFISHQHPLPPLYASIFPCKFMIIGSARFLHSWEFFSSCGKGVFFCITYVLSILIFLISPSLAFTWPFPCPYAPHTTTIQGWPSIFRWISSLIKSRLLLDPKFYWNYLTSPSAVRSTALQLLLCESTLPLDSHIRWYRPRVISFGLSLLVSAELLITSVNCPH